MQLAPSTLPLGRRGVNPVEMAKHVEPIAEFWRTGVQIPPAPPNKQKDVFGRLFFMPEIPRPRPLPTARQQDALPKQGVVSLQLRARHGAPASGEGQEALLVGHEGLLAELALMGAERHLRAQLP